VRSRAREAGRDLERLGGGAGGRGGEGDRRRCPGIPGRHRGLARVRELPGEVADRPLGPIEIRSRNTGGTRRAWRLDNSMAEMGAAFRSLVWPPRLIERCCRGMRERAWGRIVNVTRADPRAIQGLAISNANRMGPRAAEDARRRGGGGRDHGLNRRHWDVRTADGPDRTDRWSRRRRREGADPARGSGRTEGRRPGRVPVLGAGRYLTER